MEVRLTHGVTLAEARERLSQVVDDVKRQSGILLRRIEWNSDRTAVTLFGPGLEVRMQVDALQVLVTADAPLLGRLLGSGVVERIRGIVLKSFRPGLPGTTK